MVELLFLTAIGMLGLAIWQLHQVKPLRLPKIPFPVTPRATPVKALQIAPPAVDIHGSVADHLRVLTHAELLQVTGLQQALMGHLFRLSQLSSEAYKRDLLPSLERYAEYVQLVPASESHHHANRGGLLAHTLETIFYALTLRTGHLLPRNGGAEVTAAQRDHWTYALFFAALLHDVGKPVADLRVEMRMPKSADSVRWMPLSGSMVAHRAEQYLVNFAPKSERDYAAHGKLGLTLLHQLVPSTALTFLSRCPDAMKELTEFLNGVKSGALADIVREADQRSTKRNVEGGSRARFATARSIPLNELLMNAMQDMLRQGGLLPLNRDGAIGWVYDGSCWFVGKRLADTVREFIVSRAGPEVSIPGTEKNDRLFDCWQEYGLLVKNPATQQAIWHVVVHGKDGAGYRHPLTMLRFPLENLFPQGPDSYPPEMSGHIEVTSKSKAPTGELAGGPGDLHLEEVLPEVAAVPSASPGAKEQASEIPTPRFPDKKPKSKQKVVLAPPGGGVDRAHAVGSDEDFLSPEQCAVKERPSNTSRAKRAMPAAQSPEVASDVGREFLRWLQTGLTDGSMKYNESGAQVHFVTTAKNSVGIALVSPAIFKEYANEFGEPDPPERVVKKDGADQIGLAVQREVLRLGVHLPAPNGSGNVWTFQVVARAASKPVKLYAVVLANAGDWILEPPLPNPTLQLADG